MLARNEQEAPRTVAPVTASPIPLLQERQLGKISGMSLDASAEGLAPSMQVGQMLRCGEVVQLPVGFMRVQLDGGPELLIEGPAEFSLVGDESVFVRSGRLSAKGGQRLLLQTPLLTAECLDASVSFEASDDDSASIYVAEGVVTLHSRDAIVHGTVLRYEPAEKKQTLGYWVRKEDGASWNFTLNTPGVYDVEVLQGCGTGQGGSTVVVSAGSGEPLEFVVEETGHFQNFKPRIIGQVKFDAAGKQSLAIQPKTIAKAAACDIRQVRLWPVRK